MKGEISSDMGPIPATSTSGWRDLKTMEFYIRVAGVDEKGATDCLSILPSEAEVMENVVNLFNFK